MAGVTVGSRNTCYRAARYGLTRTGLAPVGLHQLLLAPSEIRAVGRQENGTRPASLDCFFDPVDLMCGNIVQKDDLTLLQSWSKDLFNISQEVGAVHWAIQHKWGVDAIIVQPAYESRSFPVAVWHLINEPFALRSPAIEAGHFGGGGGLIDEDKLLRIKD